MNPAPPAHTPRYMHAYYHTFTPTGVDTVDAILEAIAHAGKSYHNTDQWDEPNCVAKDGYWQMIQERATATAESHAALLAALEPLAAIARIYDAQVYPPDSDSQLVSVCLGDLRKALAAITQATVKP